MNPTTLKATAVFVLLAFASGCASTTVINSQPSGADVYIDGMKVGKTPYTLTDTKMVFQTSTIKLSKPGYEDVHANLPRFQELDVGTAIGGIFCLWPLWLWVGKYRPEQNYELERGR